MPREDSLPKGILCYIQDETLIVLCVNSVSISVGVHARVFLSLILNTRPGFTGEKRFFVRSKFHNKLYNLIHELYACTYFNAFLILILNIVMPFQNVDILLNIFLNC